MTDIRLLYVTTPDEETARRIAEALVEEHLAACVNILAPMRSVYRWEGVIEDSVETPMIVKTSAAKAATARDRVLELHPYETPAIIALDVEAGASAPAFLQWIEDETRG